MHFTAKRAVCFLLIISVLVACFAGCHSAKDKEPLTLKATYISKNKVWFDVSQTYDDFPVSIMSIELLCGGEVAQTAVNASVREFSGLKSATPYTVRVKYAYLLDGESEAVLAEAFADVVTLAENGKKVTTANQGGRTTQPTTRRASMTLGDILGETTDRVTTTTSEKANGNDRTTATKQSTTASRKTNATTANKSTQKTTKTSTTVTTTTTKTTTATTAPEWESITLFGTETSYGRLFKVEEFGAVGNDSVDDGLAIRDAIYEAKQYIARNADKRAVIEFGANKTYIAKQPFSSQNGESSVLVRFASNITLKGNNTTIVGDPKYRYVAVENSSNVTVDGFNFDYDTPSACSATVVSRNGTQVVLDVPSWYTACIGKAQPRSHWFAIPDIGSTRHHSFINTIKKISSTRVRVTFLSGGYSLMNKGTKVFLPTPGYAHNGTAAFFSGDCGDGVEWKNINIYSAAEFVFQISGNGQNDSQSMKFTNVKLVQKHSKTVSWRDVIHAKDNRLRLVVDGCDFRGAHDDLFNISCMSLRVTGASGGVYSLYGEGYNGAYPKFQVGDTLQVIGSKETATITQIVRNVGTDIRICTDKTLSVGDRFFINEMAAPAEIKNSKFNGSLRIKASGSTITNCQIETLFMRTGYEGDIEGPFSSDITYKNCTFTRVSGSDSGALCTFWDTVNNIRFVGCSIPSGFVQSYSGVSTN